MMFEKLNRGCFWHCFFGVGFEIMTRFLEAGILSLVGRVDIEMLYSEC